jgi:hypothetical protein
MSNSKKKLDQLGFDPMEKLVAVYNRLEREDKYYTAIREADEVIDLKTKKKRRYSSVAHTNVLSQMRDIGSDLLRYKYARVSETESEKEIPNINIVLNK